MTSFTDDDNCNAESDAAGIICEALKLADASRVRCEDECLETIDGPDVVFELPRMWVKVKRCPFPDLMACYALEAAGLALMEASRAAYTQFKDPGQRPVKSPSPVRTGLADVLKREARA